MINKYNKSQFCRSELSMARSIGLPIFPLLLNDFRFGDLDSGLQFSLSIINCINLDSSQPQEVLTGLMTTMRRTLATETVMRPVAGLLGF